MAQNQSYSDRLCSSGTNSTRLTSALFKLNNTSQNVSSPPVPNDNSACWSISLEARMSLLCLYALISLLGIVGNSMVCYVLGKKKARSGSEVFMMSLSVADLLTSAIFIPFVMINDLLSSDLKWYWGAAMCYTLPSISLATTMTSSYTLVLIAAERYRTIVHPMLPKISFKTKCIGVMFTWVIGIGFSIPNSMAMSLEKGMYCMASDKYLTIVMLATYFTCWTSGYSIIPLITIAILYSRCIKKLNEVKFEANGNKALERRNEQNRNIVKMFINIVVLFFVCTVPYAIFYAVVVFLLAYQKAADAHSLIWTLNYALFVPTCFNSCINPLIYAKKHKEINEFVRKIWRKVCCRTTEGRNADKAAKYKMADVQQKKEEPGASNKSSKVITKSHDNKAYVD